MESYSLITIELADAALATSGDYARCIEIDGHRYGHLLNPKTGWPVRGALSVSVIAPTCLTAGAVATVGCLHEGTAAEAWLDGAELPWLLIDETRQATGPLAAYIHR